MNNVTKVGRRNPQNASDLEASETLTKHFRPFIRGQMLDEMLIIYKIHTIAFKG
jgi:hypothetical protein